jgi:hypothetical protein
MARTPRSFRAWVLAAAFVLLGTLIFAFLLSPPEPKPQRAGLLRTQEATADFRASVLALSGLPGHCVPLRRGSRGGNSGEPVRG